MERRRERGAWWAGGGGRGGVAAQGRPVNVKPEPPCPSVLFPGEKTLGMVVSLRDRREEWEVQKER